MSFEAGLSEASAPATRRGNDFIRDIIEADLRAGRCVRVATRFPPEPNGYLHIGHAKSICLNFGIARDYGGTCNLRYDDTNPETEDVEYVRSIEADVRWLGFTPDRVSFASDYFLQMYELAERLVREGHAYVCDLDEEQIRIHRGSLSEPGRPSPYRNRSVEENLDLLRRMRAGEFPDGTRTLRAKIDMASANMKLRDPPLYRIRHAKHHRTGREWCIYPMYDYAHPLEDALEGITHSLCTLEFENNRALYDWVLDHTGPWNPRPRQYEFARLALDYTVMSKRKLLILVEGGHVRGWDDPRMPTIAGMRRRGISPEALRAFADLIGVAKTNSTVDIGKLEHCIRQDLNQHAPRVLGVLDPIEVELVGITPAVIEAPYFPADIGKPGSRALPLGTRIYIDRDDWRDEPPPGYQRLAPGRTVRLRYGPCITADEVLERDAAGRATKLRAVAHPETLGGGQPEGGRKVWGVVHWVDADTSVRAEVRLYDRLFVAAKPEEGGDFLQHLNPSSLVVLRDARVEQSLEGAPVGSRWQLERVGYFAVDPDTKPGALVLNRIIGLRDSYAEKNEVAVAPPPEPRQKRENPKAKTRPKTKSPREYRAEARARDPHLAAAHDAILALGLGPDAADLLSGDRATAELFLATTKLGAPAELTAKWMINELPRALEGKDLADAALDPARFAAFLAKVPALTGAVAKQVLATIATSRTSVEDAVKAHAAPAIGIEQIAAETERLIAAHPDKAAHARAGRVGLIGFFVGQILKSAPGADPKEVGRVVRERLGVH
jgi:glutaminyl-tRNA synthetase